MMQLLSSPILVSLLLAPHQAAPHDAPAASSIREVVLYDVRDIALGERNPRTKESSDVETVWEMSERLASLLRSFGPLGDGEWVFTLPQNEHLQGLGVFAGPEAHAWVREWLALQRGADMLEVEARFMQAPRGRFAELGFDLDTASGLGDEQREKLSRAQAEEDVELLAAPRIRTWSLTRADISTYEKVSFIKDWRLVVVEPGGYEIADPVIDTVQAGTRLEVLGTLLPGGTIGLELTMSHSELERPIETRQVRLRPDDERTVEVALPSVAKSSIETRAILADGAAILRGGVGSKRDHELGFLVEARVVRPRVEGPGHPRAPHYEGR